MIALKIFSIAAVLIWLWPPIKQYKTEFFYTFLVTAFAQPLMLLIMLAFRINVNYLYPSFYLLLLATLINKKRRPIMICLVLLTSVIMPLIKPPSVILFSLSTIIELLATLKVLHLMLEYYLKSQMINVFLILFLCFFAVDMFKLIGLTLNFESGVVVFFLGVFSQMFFGVAFWFININTKSFKVPLKGFHQMK